MASQIWSCHNSNINNDKKTLEVAASRVFLCVNMYKTIQNVQLCKLVEKQEIIWHNTDVATPRQARKGGSAVTELLVSFLISVVASIVAYYICKWLDGDK